MSVHSCLWLLRPTVDQAAAPRVGAKRKKISVIPTPCNFGVSIGRRNVVSRYCALLEEAAVAVPAYLKEVQALACRESWPTLRFVEFKVPGCEKPKSMRCMAKSVTSEVYFSFVFTYSF